MLSIKIGEPQPVKITIVREKVEVSKEILMIKTLTGDYILKEHPEIDIVVMPSKQKIVVFPKKIYTDKCTKIQLDLFEFLKDKGVILPESIRGGNIFGTLEAAFPKQGLTESQDPVQVVVYTISNFIDKDRPKQEYAIEYEKAVHDELTAPDEKSSTELGEVPQNDIKGTVPKWGFPQKAIYRYTY
jgi:hypothetical protein